ncbi:unnamed protein product [Mytilus coruscus]|uniref:Uncharacterized protein n=1 Tax=Mytilus coruscus TaxID=42192 RepID=A0A6J8EI60_MYTCO|nr:unnamed protein product [Mytilus coruscus]
MHQIEQIVHQCQCYAEDMENNEKISEIDIKIEQNDEIEKILRELKSLESFGEVKVVKSKIAMNRETSVRREAQVELQEQSNMYNMTMNIETKIESPMKGNTMISDMICLIDGRVIVVEWKSKVKLLTLDGKLQRTLPVPGRAWNVTQINRDTIVIY